MLPQHVSDLDHAFRLSIHDRATGYRGYSKNWLIAGAFISWIQSLRVILGLPSWQIQNSLNGSAAIEHHPI